MHFLRFGLSSILIGLSSWVVENCPNESIGRIFVFVCCDRSTTVLSRSFVIFLCRKS